MKEYTSLFCSSNIIGSNDMFNIVETYGSRKFLPRATKKKRTFFKLILKKTKKVSIAAKIERGLLRLLLLGL